MCHLAPGRHGGTQWSRWERHTLRWGLHIGDQRTEVCVVPHNSCGCFDCCPCWFCVIHIGSLQVVEVGEGGGWSKVGLRDDEQLGRAIAMSELYVAVGGLQDIVHVYNRDEREEVELQGPKKSEFGRSLAMTSTHLVVGAPSYFLDQYGYAGGAVFVYVLDDAASSSSSRWSHEKLFKSQLLSW